MADNVISKIEKFLEWGGYKKDIFLLIISAIALIISLFNLINLPFDIAWVAIILCGIPITLEAIIGLITKFDIKADVLVSIALIASLCIGEDFAAGEVAFIMQLGALLENLTVAKAKKGIEKLIKMTPETARRIDNGIETIVSVEDIKVGNVIRIIPGETIPVDGIIISGNTSVNQAVMTGESVPADKTVGDTVLSGTINMFGSFDMTAQKTGKNSSIQKMIELVKQADANKAKIVRLTDNWATWIVVTALSAALGTWIVTGEIIRAVTILVVFCPCALVLATPTAIIAAIGNLTKHGFLVRQADALERLAKVNIITFDKTGTLTEGTLEIEAIETFSSEISKQNLLQITASAELLSEHPLAKAVVKKAEEENINIIKPEKFEMFPGKGIEAFYENKKILAGNFALLEGKNIAIQEEHLNKLKQYTKQGATIIYVCINNIFVGFISLTDTIRQNAKDMITKINNLNIKPVLLTGDNIETAQNIAKKLSINEVTAQCLPEDKMNFIEKTQKQNINICMIGDGINDAPALKKAYVGIAMGKIGSDIAVDAADMVLVNDDIKEIPYLIKLSKHTMKVIKYNLAFSMVLNFAAIVLAAQGFLNPVIGALVHNAGSVFVIINSAFLLKYKTTEK